MSVDSKDFSSGLLAGLAQVLVGQPLDLMKVKIQTATSSISLVQIIKDVYQSYGFKGFYRGASGVFLGFPAAVGVEFTLYEWGKRQLYSLRSNRSGLYNAGKLELWEVGLAGAFTAFMLAFLYCPIEYAKIQKQVSSSVT